MKKKSALTPIWTKSSLAFLLYYGNANYGVHGFLPHQFWTRKSSHILSSSSSSSLKRKQPLQLYFDDVSRYSVPWEPDDNDMTPGISPQKLREIKERAKQDKADAMKRMLGYDLESALELSVDQIKDEIYNWAAKYEFVGTDFGKDVYTSIMWMSVCESSTIPGIMSEFWQTVLDVITVEQICDAESIEWGNENDDNQENMEFYHPECNLNQEKVYMIVLPNCPELYDYKTVQKVHAALEYCQNMCSYFGKKFKLTHFHPSFQNAPRLIHADKHSPFPCFGLQFSSTDNNANEESIYDDMFTSEEWIDEQRSILETLFRDVSASSPSDVLDQEMTTSLQNRQDLSNEEIIQLTQDWIETHRIMTNHRESESSNQSINNALKHADSIQEWKVIEDDTAEGLYTNIWQTVTELTHNTEIDENSNKTISSMIMIPHYQVFNSESFKRFAITVNASLKLFVPDGSVTLEMFHPEYLGKTENLNDTRRSPFPSIQIIWHGKE